MTYRLLVVVVAIALILLLVLGFWITARLFLRHHGRPGDRSEQALRLMAWSFAGFGVGLILVGVGGPVLGTLAFARTAREMSEVPWAVAVLWGLVGNSLNALIVGSILVALVLNQ
jgi:uncharacterized protein YneF (UPF0154 family)